MITEAASYLNREDATTQEQVHIQSLKELLFCLTGCPNMEKEGYLPFGHISLPPYQVFYASSFSFPGTFSSSLAATSLHSTS